MTQLPLLLETRAMARSRDPEGSHRAAECMVKSGAAASQRERVLEVLGIMSMGVTSRQLAEWANLDRHMVARRLPELERAGLVERTPGGPNGQVLWRAK